MTDAISREALLPCPMCGAAMIDSPDPGFSEHPPTETCILGHMLIAPDEIAAWNARATGWQPIATAPRDWMWFIGLSPTEGMSITMGYSAFQDDNDLTHWMPLPAPPVSAEGEE